MQPTAGSETDRAFEVAPEISHTVPWRVTSVTVLPDAQLEVTFVDGTTGKVDMWDFLNSSKVDGTVFEPLRDPPSLRKRESLWERSSGLAASISHLMQQLGAWRQQREPDVEVVQSRVVFFLHSARQKADRADSQALARFARRTDLKRSQIHRRAEHFLDELYYAVIDILGGQSMPSRCLCVLR